MSRHYLSNVALAVVLTSGMGCRLDATFRGDGSVDMAMSSGDDMAGGGGDDLTVNAGDLSSNGPDMVSMCPAGQTCLYVSGSGPSCPGGAGSGTMADPYCKIQTALDAGNGKTIIILSGIYSETLTINPATDYTTTAIAFGAIVESAGQTALTVGQMNASVTVTLDGWKVMSSDIGLSCSGVTAGRVKMSIRRSQFTQNRIGIESAFCDMTIDDVIIGPFNTGGGITVHTTDITMTNTLIERNGSSTATFGGFAQDGQFNRSQIVNVTAVDNTCSTSAVEAPGITCNATPIGSAAFITFNNVVYGNAGGTVAPVEINTLCNPDHSAYKGGSGTNIDLTSCADTQLFADPANNNWRPKTGGTSPCKLIDVGTASYAGVNAPNQDLDGVARPVGGGFDVGAYEYH